MTTLVVVGRSIRRVPIHRATARTGSTLATPTSPRQRVNLDSEYTEQTNSDFKLVAWYLGQTISERLYIRRYGEAYIDDAKSQARDLLKTRRGTAACCHVAIDP